MEKIIKQNKIIRKCHVLCVKHHLELGNCSVTVKRVLKECAQKYLDDLGRGIMPTWPFLYIELIVS